MRVTTAFNRMLGFRAHGSGMWRSASEGVIVTVALSRKRPVCSGCGARGLKIKDHRVKRWRHLDLGGLRCVIECRLQTAVLPGVRRSARDGAWARGGRAYTRDFDDLTAWLAQQMSQTQVTRLMRIGWESVGNILDAGRRREAARRPAGRAG